MTDRLDVAALTPDDHLSELRKLARDFDRFASDVERRNGPTRFSTGWRRSAAAIRWILAETAYGVDPSELAV